MLFPLDSGEGAHRDHSRLVVAARAGRAASPSCADSDDVKVTTKGDSGDLVTSSPGASAE